MGNLTITWGPNQNLTQIREETPCIMPNFDLVLMEGARVGAVIVEQDGSQTSHVFMAYQGHVYQLTRNSEGLKEISHVV